MIDPFTNARLKTHCYFIADEGLSQTDLAKKLSKSEAFTWKPSSSDNVPGKVHFVLDTGCLGEASSHPHLRKPSVQFLIEVLVAPVDIQVFW